MERGTNKNSKKKKKIQRKHILYILKGLNLGDKPLLKDVVQSDIT